MQEEFYEAVTILCIVGHTILESICRKLSKDLQPPTNSTYDTT